MIYSNLKKILDDRGITIRQVEKAIDYRFETIRKMYNDELERYPRELISRLCNFLNVTPGDLLKIK